MATLVIRNIEDTVHKRLKEQAAAHQRSMEEEARQILCQSLAVAPGACAKLRPGNAGDFRAAWRRRSAGDRAPAAA